MIEKEKNISVNFKTPIKIFWEDIEKINQIYTSNFDSYKIENEDFEFNSIEELKKIKDDGNIRITNLTFKSNSPYISINLSPMDAKIYSANSDTKSMGIVTGIQNIIKKRTRIIGYLSRNLIILPLFWLLMMLVGIALPINFRIILLVIFVIYLLWAAWAMHISMNRFSLIFLTEKKKEKNFFLKNKDQILINIFNTVLGAILGIAGTIVVLKIQGVI